MSAWAVDVSVTENYATAGNLRYSSESTSLSGEIETRSGKTFQGVLAVWNYRFVRSRTTKNQQDILDGERAFLFDRSANTSKTPYVECNSWEGGIKKIEFKWQQVSADDDGQQLDFQIILKEGSTTKTDHISCEAGEAYRTSVQNYASGAIIDSKANSVKLSLYNKSMDNAGTAVAAGRILVGNLKITPYLLYRQKDVTIGLKQRGYINNELINNTESGTISYSSNATDIATVDEDGYITPVAVGDAVITATWDEGVTTSYTIHVEDGIVVENFSKVSKLSQVTTEAPWNSDLFSWKWRVLNTRRGYDDTLGLSPRIQATALRIGTGETFVYSNQKMEGGVKHISFDWRQWASATSPLTISAYYSSSKTDWGNAVVTQSEDAVAASTPHNFNEDIDDGAKGNAYLKIAYTSGAGHAVMGAIKITPWLLYTTKTVEMDIRGEGALTYTNPDLINNTGDTPEFSITNYGGISPSKISIDENGQVIIADRYRTGNVMIQAKWSNVTTTYTLQIQGMIATTATFAKDSVYAVNSVEENALTYTDGYDDVSHISYASSNPEVAAVDAETGAVTLQGVGQTKITATLPETSNYTAATASYMLTVMYANYETFSDFATEGQFAGTQETAGGWTTQMAGINTNQYFPANVIMMRAPRTNESSKTAFVESPIMHGGISKLAFNFSKMYAETDVQLWDIQVYVNDRLVGELTSNTGDVLEGEGGRTLKPMPTKMIADINEPGNFVIRFENHSTMKDGVKYDDSNDGNKARFAIDNVSWENFAGAIVLDENANNSSVIAANSGATADVELTRSALKGGVWNTLCLPFALPVSTLGVVENGVQQLTSAELNGDELTVGFTAFTGENLVAGTPYLVKPASDLDISGTYYDKQITSIASAVSYSIITMQGIFSPYAMTAGDKNTLFVGTPKANGENLFYPSQDGSLKGFRAYFTLNLGSNPAPKRARFVVNQTEIATDIEVISGDRKEISGKFIENGQLIIIRDGKKYNAMGQVIK